MAPQVPPSVWVVHAGRGGRDARAFEAAGIVGLALPPVVGLADMDRAVALEAIIHAMEQEKADFPMQSGRNQSLAALLLRFVHSVQVADLVVTPNGLASEALFGIVTGDYALVEPPAVEGYHHVRSVHWHGRMSKQLLPAQIIRSIGAPSPLFKPGAAEQIRHLEVWGE